jgi:hypothetical protein
MGDHDYGTHDTNLCMECLGYAIGYRVALREAADASETEGGMSDRQMREWLRDRADTGGGTPPECGCTDQQPSARGPMCVTCGGAL